MSREQSMMKVLVVGGTGGSGRAAAEAALAAGDYVTVFSRSADRIGDPSGRLQALKGDAMNPQDLDRAVEGQDAVIVTLGITGNPLSVRFGKANTALNVRSQGTRNVVAAMRKHGVRRLVVQTSYGVGETRDRLGLLDRMFFELLLKPQIADTELQESAVRDSGLDWSLVQPVHLTDEEDETAPFISLTGETRRMKVSRKGVGRVLVDAARSGSYVGKSVAVSGN